MRGESAANHSQVRQAEDRPKSFRADQTRLRTV
jgi:hypothetical protein